MRDSKKRFWRLKNHSKSSSKGLKIHAKSSSKAIVLQRTPLNIIFFWNIYDFLMIFRLQNALKIRGKTLQIRCFKTTRFWIRISNGFSLFWPPKTKAKSSNLSIFIENTNFAKIIVFLKGNHYFLIRSLEKSTKIGCSNAMKNNIKKKPRKSNLGSHLAFQSP